MKLKALNPLVRAKDVGIEICFSLTIFEYKHSTIQYYPQYRYVVFYVFQNSFDILRKRMNYFTSI